MRRNTRDKAKKQHEFQFNRPDPWQTGPRSLPIESYQDYVSFSDIAVDTAFDDETIDALKNAAKSYKTLYEW